MRSLIGIGSRAVPSEVIQIHHRVIRASGHPYEELDNGVVLLSIVAGRYYRLNEVGSEVWRALEKEITVSILCKNVAEKFGVETTVIERDIVLFLNQLLEHRLISIVLN